MTRNRAVEKLEQKRADRRAKGRCELCEKPTEGTVRCKACSKRVEAGTDRYRGQGRRGPPRAIDVDVRDLEYALEAASKAAKGFREVAGVGETNARRRRELLIEPRAQVELTRRFAAEVLDRHPAPVDDADEVIELDGEPADDAPAGYQDRKVAGLCVRCGRAATDDSLYCRVHHDEQLVYARTAKQRKRAALRAMGRCAMCGARSERFRCKKCSGAGVQIGVQIKRTAHLKARTWRDGGNRTRYHGRSNRGAPSQTDIALQEIRDMIDALRKAEAGCIEAAKAEIAALPRIQREAARRAWLSFVDLGVRFGEDMLARCNYHKDLASAAPRGPG